MNLAAMSHRPESEDCFLYTNKKLRLRFHTAQTMSPRWLFCMVILTGKSLISINNIG